MARGQWGILFCQRSPLLPATQAHPNPMIWRRSHNVCHVVSPCAPVCPVVCPWCQELEKLRAQLQETKGLWEEAVTDALKRRTVVKVCVVGCGFFRYCCAFISESLQL